VTRILPAHASALGKLYASPIVPNAAVYPDDNMLGRHGAGGLFHLVASAWVSGLACNISVCR
jgi:hypothetical protein